MFYKRLICILFAFCAILAVISVTGCGGEPEIPAAITTETGIDTVLPESETEEDIIMREADGYNYIIGTQAFSPNYQFTDKPPLEEIADCIDEMGSNMIKFYATDDKLVDTLLEGHNFKYVFMWYRSDPYFKDEAGYTDAEAKADYDAFYAYTKKLLTEYNGSGIEFYLGHWEGDWYFLDNYDVSQKTVNEKITTGMINWLNTRQQAVDDAKRDTPHENVEVWNYLEVNRPYDALGDRVDRVVNRVLPYTNIDFVSYSAYDTMDANAKVVAKTIDKIYEMLPKKEGIEGPRVFVGEVGQPAANCGFDGERHRDVNLTNIAKYLACDIKFLLYWQMYDNEKLEDGSCRGFWLIDDKNVKQPLYDAFADIYVKAKKYVTEYRTENGILPSISEYREFLLSIDEFQ